MLSLPNNGTVVCYVIRHGLTSLNKDNRFRGNADPPLVPEGIKQAHTLAELFKDKDIGPIFCSDKQRSVKTAEILAQSKNSEIHQSEGLRALDVGDFSGKPRNKESESALQKYLDTPEEQIPGGESLNDFKARIQPCLQEAVELFTKCGVPPVLVAHSSVVHECGQILYGDHKKILVQPGGAIAIYFDGSRLQAKPIFRPLQVAKGIQASTIT